MDSEERDICAYLKGYPGQFVALAEIARRAGGKKRFNKNPHWPLPFLNRLIETKVIESDSTGHYRLKPPPPPDKKKKRWVSPQIQKILEKSGKNFGDQIVKIEDPGDSP